MKGRSMRRKKSRQAKGAIEIIEEAVHLLRLSPAGLLGSYYIGTLPFILALLYFWADMSRKALAEEYCAVASLGLALLFVWMKCWHAVFVHKIRARITRQTAPHWSLGRIARLSSTQSTIQASGLFLLPITLFLTVPFGWFYAFYQNVSAQDEGINNSVKTLFNKSWQQARLWPGQNHILLLVFSLFGIFVFLNLALSILLLPYMLKKFLGIETMFTMSGWRVLNTTFLATAFALTYLCMDPLVKTVYALRCFYGTSLRTGEDLRTELKNFVPNGKVLVAILIFFLGVAPIRPLMADEQAKISASEYRFQNRQLSPEELDHSIEEVMNRREFTWRMPREGLKKEKSKKRGPIAQAMEWILQVLKDVIKAIGRWIGKVMDWLEELLPATEPVKETPGVSWTSLVRKLLLVLLVVLSCLLAVFFRRTWKRRRLPERAIATESIPSEPDLNDDRVEADELPANRWLTLAKEMVEKGDFRLALRAIFLAILAHLAKHEMITIAKHKSNRDYERELYRRAHHQQSLLDIFSRNVSVFDRSWYGKHDVTKEDLKLFTANQERIMSFAKE